MSKLAYMEGFKGCHLRAAYGTLILTNAFLLEDISGLTKKQITQRIASAMVKAKAEEDGCPCAECKTSREVEEQMKMIDLD